ncbi:MAG: family 6 glucosyltransferase [Candidatus Gracilibacteria bacterium]|nr:family 6 glucosyltransferase [Candidatus Gracilibacteria bacterium]
MKIGILYMCSGKYEKFFDGFYESSKRLFLTDKEKHYFVFTDSKRLLEQYGNNKDITFIEQRTLGWPIHTLFRFWMFRSIKEQLLNYDFLVFFNANFVFLEKIGDEFLPNGRNEKLIAGLHAWFYNKPSFLYPYDRNRKSSAYIPYWKRGKYYQGSLNGGFTNDYLNLIETCFNNIQTELNKNVIAKWFDESHLNKYLLGRSDVKSLDVSYNYPEGSNLPFKPKIMLLNKGGGDGHKEIRNI